jgi:hypothetical protein
MNQVSARLITHTELKRTNPVNFSLYGNETYQVVTKFSQAAVKHLLTYSLHPTNSTAVFSNITHKSAVQRGLFETNILDKEANTVKKNRDVSSWQRDSIVQCANLLPMRAVLTD